MWETIWAARFIASSHYVLFVALALVQYYRDIILANTMDFTDIIKFFNGKFFFVFKLPIEFLILLHFRVFNYFVLEMAERHDSKAMLRMARDLVLQLQMLIEDK